MSASVLVRSLAGRGVELSADGGRLRVKAPRGVLSQSDRDDLARLKADVLALVATGLDDADPPIGVPADHWRWRVANLPPEAWTRWRARSAEIQAEWVEAIGQPATAAEIDECEMLAAAELGVEGAGRPLPAIPGATRKVDIWHRE